MKEVNLFSVVQAYKNLDAPIYIRYFDYFRIDPKVGELDDLSILVSELESYGVEAKIFNRYFFGYTIPQISKEFDLLRFGEEFIVNIELKKTCTEDKVKKQLVRNKYYLDFLGKSVFSYTFVSDTKVLYTLDEDSNIYETDFEELITILESQALSNIVNLDDLFNPSNYLVSPFNSTEKFIEAEYFLTAQQETIKRQVLSEINKRDASFVCICGKAGTGKTLLTYDIARECMSSGMNVLIVHCGKLNSGHYLLRDEGWDIIPIKEIGRATLSKYHLIILDETQRIYPGQLAYTIKEVKASNSNCIFSYDKQQCLTGKEMNNDIEQIILQKASPEIFELTAKIRTNKEIAGFIACLFDKSKRAAKFNASNIQLNYFDNYTDAREYMELLNTEDWKIINYTPCTRNKHPYNHVAIFMEDNTHDVIGQEFDNVVAVIDSHFYYKSNHQLSTRNYKNRPFYHPTKMLYQIVTRTRSNLNLIVIKNQEVMERCLSILQ